MPSDAIRCLGRLLDASFRLEIVIFTAIFGFVAGYFVYGQLLAVGSQVVALAGGGAVGVVCAGVVAYLAVTMEW